MAGSIHNVSTHPLQESTIDDEQRLRRFAWLAGSGANREIRLPQKHRDFWRGGFVIARVQLQLLETVSQLWKVEGTTKRWEMRGEGNRFARTVQLPSVPSIAPVVETGLACFARQVSEDDDVAVAVLRIGSDDRRRDDADGRIDAHNNASDWGEDFDWRGRAGLSFRLRGSAVIN